MTTVVPDIVQQYEDEDYAWRNYRDKHTLSLKNTNYSLFYKHSDNPLYKEFSDTYIPSKESESTMIEVTPDNFMELQQKLLDYMEDYDIVHTGREEAQQDYRKLYETYDHQKKRIEELREKHNHCAIEFNKLQNEHNEFIDKYNKLNDKYNTLIDRIYGTIEEQVFRDYKPEDGASLDALKRFLVKHIQRHTSSQPEEKDELIRQIMDPTVSKRIHLTKFLHSNKTSQFTKINKEILDALYKIVTDKASQLKGGRKTRKRRV